jgi:hypothetical protein
MSYGYCPRCNAPGKDRERRLDGNDTCENGHVYRSKASLKEPLTDMRLEVACRAFHEARTEQGFTTARWDDLEDRNREQYRAAMRRALQMLAEPRS